MMNADQWLPLIWILPLAALALYVGSARFLGTEASSRAGYLLKSGLDNRRFTILSNLDLSCAGRVIHFDHIVLAQTGIFVIDAYHWAGAISGKKVQAQWKRKKWGRTQRLDNPVHENFLRVQALERSLGLPLSCFYPLVAVSGHSVLQTDALDVVCDLGVLTRKINSQSRQLINQEQTSAALLRIQSLKVEPGLLGRTSSWKLLRIGLLGLLSAAIYHAYGEPLIRMGKQLQYTLQKDGGAVPGESTQTSRSVTELWEDSLICSYSIDTERCACYQPDGDKAEIEQTRCKTLAERGSVIQQ